LKVRIGVGKRTACGGPRRFQVRVLGLGRRAGCPLGCPRGRRRCHRPRPRHHCRGVVVARELSWQGSSGGTSEGRSSPPSLQPSEGAQSVHYLCSLCSLGSVRRFRDSRPKPSNAVDGHMGTVLDGCCPSRLPSVLWLRLSCQRHGYGSRTTDPSGPYCTVTVSIPSDAPKGTGLSGLT
jgi:hypothetical protein